jgi:CT1975-like protein/HD domain
VGKISTGFLRKCPTWLIQCNLAEAAVNEFWQGAESDHSVVSQFCLQRALKPNKAELWAVAIGAHRGRVHGRAISQMNQTAQRTAWEEAARDDLDFYSAVDDLKPKGDDAGAGMIGTIEFTSAVYYRYVRLSFLDAIEIRSRPEEKGLARNGR